MSASYELLFTLDLGILVRQRKWRTIWLILHDYITIYVETSIPALKHIPD